MNDIRILDLNIWNYNEPWEIRRDLIVDLILDTKPDIVALQEIQYRKQAIDPRHQADQILVGLPDYSGIWRPAHHSTQRWEGLAVFSQYPIIDQEFICLSRNEADPRDTFQRIVLGARIKTPGRPFWLFDTHFPLSAQARERVVVEALDFVIQTAKECPFCFTGDFNAEPHELPIQFLTGEAEIDGRRGDLIDVWVQRHSSKPGYTFSAWEPGKRIDYMFVSPAVQMCEIDIAGAVPDREIIAPSDHCGLLATIEIDS